MSDIPEIDIYEAKTRIDAGAFLLDVREQDEYDNSRIVGVNTHIPLGELTTRYDDLPQDQEIIVSCRSGGRSARATKFLIEQGYKAVNMAGGILAWYREDYATEPEGNVPQ